MQQITCNCNTLQLSLRHQNHLPFFIIMLIDMHIDYLIIFKSTHPKYICTLFCLRPIALKSTILSLLSVYRSLQNVSFIQNWIKRINYFNLTIKLIYMDTNVEISNKEQQMIETNFKLDREHEDEMPYSIQSQIDTVVANIKLYLSILLTDSPSVEEIEEYKKKLITQLQFLNSDYVHTEIIQKFSDQHPSTKDLQGNQEAEQYDVYKKTQEFGEAMKKLMIVRADTQSEQQFQKYNTIIEGFLKEMEIIILQDNYTINRIQNYEPEDNNLSKSCESNDKQVDELPPDHYWRKQKIEFRTWQPPKVFQWVEPPKHRVYISQATKVYSDVVPFKIKFVCLSSLDEPKIDTPNYFNADLDPQKAVVHFCKPGTKTLCTYRLDDICKLLTIQKEYLLQRQLPISWSFSPQARTVITPDGRIFGINCRTTSTKQDSSLYEITPQKVSNRGRIPDPKKNASIVYCNKAIYIIGGNNDKQKCSIKNYKYSLRDKKWVQVADSNVALRKPTVCTFRDRYIFKIGGLNQFDYINKVIELYDTTTDKWSVVRATARNVLEEVQILQDSLAVQMADDQIYVFAGKNANGYRADTGLVLHIMEIREKIKAPAKVAGDLWNVSIGKKNVFSFFGLFAQSNVIPHNNCLYAMRAETCKLERM